MVEKFENLVQKDTLRRELILNWCIAGPSILVKRTHYLSMSYDESSPIDDFDFFLSLLETDDNIEVISQKVCLYRVHDFNTSKTKGVDKRLKNLNAFLDIIMKYEVKTDSLKELPVIRSKTQAKIFFFKKNTLKVCGKF